MNTPPASKSPWQLRRAIILIARKTIIVIGYVIGLVVLFALLGALFSWTRDIPLLPRPQDTPEQIEARRIAAKEAKAAKAAWRNATCKQMNSCQRYGVARQQCAVAGDFNNCIKIRTGQEYRFWSANCTDNGGVRGVTDTPSTVQCFISTFFDAD